MCKFLFHVQLFMVTSLAINRLKCQVILIDLIVMKLTQQLGLYQQSLRFPVPKASFFLILGYK